VCVLGLEDLGGARSALVGFCRSRQLKEGKLPRLHPKFYLLYLKLSDVEIPR
jgi:hypothetical protein